MAGGGVVSTGPFKQYPCRTTWFLVITCITAASGGLIFGYDIGISGGVTSMPQFLKKFFPHVYEKETNAKTSDYCKFDSQILTTFTSSLYLAGLITSTLFASWITRIFGRKPSMLLGGFSFLLGAAINGFALNISMLIIGRILLGVGVGFANQSVPVYLSEMAPAQLRGALNIMFQLAITIGILAASILNYFMNKVDNGWRISLGLAGVPAIIMTVGSLFLPDTPNSLIERGKLQQGMAMLVKVRGVADVQEEFDDIVQACEVAKAVKHPWKNIIQRKYRPQFIMSLIIPFFQQLTGINAIMFYAPVLFKTIGFKDDASLYSAVITGAVNVLATVVSIVAVDKYGRRTLFLEAGFQMFISQVLMGAILGWKFGLHGTGSVDKATAIGVVVIVCVYVAAFAWSWGPLGWLVPSEIFPLEIRSAGMSINVSVNLLFTFVIAQAFLAMLCHFKFGIFLFFAGWVVVMTTFVYFLIPETRNVPIEDMVHVWRSHPYWSRFIPPEDKKPLIGSSSLYTTDLDVAL